MFRDYVYYDRINFRELHFDYFITQGDGSIICSAHDGEGNEFTCTISADGSAQHRKNQGVWKQLSLLDAAHLRYFAGKFLNRSVPTYHTQTVAF